MIIPIASVFATCSVADVKREICSMEFILVLISCFRGVLGRFYVKFEFLSLPNSS